MANNTIDEIFDDMKKSIQASAARQEAAAKYVAELVKADSMKFSGAFKETYPEQLYTKVMECIRFLNLQFSTAVGVHSWSCSQEYLLQHHPDTILGWTKAVKYVEGSSTKEITEEGKKVVDGYRSALGLVSIDEQIQRERNAVRKSAG